MKGTCIICGGFATHHHKYCDRCYPRKTSTILALKNDLRKMKNRMHRELYLKDCTIRRLKEDNRKLRKLVGES